jgi:cytochrome c oxidase subunit 2
MEQQLAVYFSVAGVLLVAVIFLRVASQASQSGDAVAIGQTVARVRGRTFWTLVVVAAVSIAASLSYLPYPAHAKEGSAVTVVNVTGAQWRWDLSRNEVPLGQPVEFRVTALDVNHGFAIYDQTLTVQAQVQAMPGYTNVLRHTFSKPGVYKLLCLEYCGLAHHVMAAELTVR